MNVQNVGGGGKICIIMRFFFLWKEWLRCFEIESLDFRDMH